MIRFLRADFMRLRKSSAFRLSIVGMLALSAGFLLMQATAMDYTVPLSRVIFLPLSGYGIAMAAFVSVFAGTDFSDGFIRNKLLAASRRSSPVFSLIVASCAGCCMVYMIVTAFSAGIGRLIFENDVEGAVFIRHFFLGFGVALVTGCLFCVVTLLCGNKTRAVIWCMALAFGLLFLCMRTNAALVQTEYKDGILNPHYVGGFRRAAYSVLHDLNPYGQAAQLSSWEVWHPLRGLFFDFLLFIGLTVLGCKLFLKKDIR